MTPAELVSLLVGFIPLGLGTGTCSEEPVEVPFAIEASAGGGAWTAHPTQPGQHVIVGWRGGEPCEVVFVFETREN